ncbi:PUA-like domain [Plasmopara halstedii]|uniref:PUA-like domain n=1 Tax=Plasmopara halstedii TaxID=4781 RepID=A0A0P1AF13_PLAHL|nr:PUA-like domain [Plasmopara halstedii]CEG38968.1 PUA-like domain [Plasmopara halstedii]|eukprot:XP_024575337.1 PUA-like domain [Plasmopara halstedii]
MPTQYELLAFPPVCDSNEGRDQVPCSKQESIASQQILNDHYVRESGYATTVTTSRQQKIVDAATSDAADISPADFLFILPERDHQLIEQGVKSLEIRLNDVPYSLIHVNDRITINGKTSTTVAAIRRYATLQSVLEAEDVKALLPQIFEEAGTVDTAAAAERQYRQFFSADEEANCGLTLFQFAKSSSKSKTSEDWSEFLLRHLETKGATGCSLADLRFAVPSLTIDQIMEVLMNLQFDALVVCKSGNYRVV